MAFTVDGKVMATGHSDSTVVVWSLTPEKLKSFYDADKLNELDINGTSLLKNVS